MPDIRQLINTLLPPPQGPVDVVSEPINYVWVQARNGHRVIATRRVKNLRTTAGRDWMASRMGNSAGTGNVANYIALSSTNAAPSAGDTTLVGELGGALARKLATYTHTTASDTYTLSTSWTSGVTTTIYRAGLFDAVIEGTLVFERSFAPIPVVSGTSVAIYWTVRLP